MTVAAVPYVEQNLSHSAALFRQAFATGFAGGGICGPLELFVDAQSSPNMTVRVSAGRAIVPGSSVSPPVGYTFTTQGAYFVLNDAQISVTISTANATNPRIDVIYVGVQDAFYSGASNTALIGVATGTPAASPAVPAIPTNTIALAQVAVAANATSIVGANVANVSALASTSLNAAVPAARVSRVAGFNTSGTPSLYLAVPWDTEQTNEGSPGSANPHSLGTNPTRFTAPIAGLYRIHGNARINTTTGSGNAQIAFNGAQRTDTLFSVTPVSGTTPFVTAEDFVQMAVGDYVEFLVASNIATINVSNASANFVYLRP